MSAAAPPVIVGGGPAGSSAAILLARAGAAPTLIERTATAGDAICGGFLSWTTVEQLVALGIDAEQLGGHRVAELSIFVDRREHRIALPGPAIGLSRHRLDALLIARAEQCGATVKRGVAARTIDDGRLLLSDGSSLPFDSLFLATGKHDLRGVARDGRKRDPALGLRARVPAGPAIEHMLGDRIELHLFDRGYLGLVRQEDGSANACLAVAKSRMRQADGDPARLFAQLAEGSAALADRLALLPEGGHFDAIGHVPYGWRAQATRPGLFRLGDQAAVIPSLAGEGVGIALASAARAVAHWRVGGAAGAISYQQAMARAVRRPMAVAGLIAALAERPALARPAAAFFASLPGAAAMMARLTRIDGGIGSGPEAARAL